MRLPEPTTQEILDQVMKHMSSQPQPQTKSSCDTGLTTPGLISAVIIAGIIWAQLSPLWLLVAVPLALFGWGTEIKHWRK